jgi:hypothetical protein
MTRIAAALIGLSLKDNPVPQHVRRSTRADDNQCRRAEIDASNSKRESHADTTSLSAMATTVGVVVNKIVVRVDCKREGDLPWRTAP